MVGIKLRHQHLKIYTDKARHTSGIFRKPEYVQTGKEPGMKRVYWSGICNDNRLICISLLEECIRKYGFITDYKFFSDISMSIMIETRERTLKALYEELLKNMKVTTEDGLDPDSDKNAECMIFFNVTFTGGTGFLRIEVPQVPG